MKYNYNAECPVCHDTWRFNPQKAILDEQEKERHMQNGKLDIVCEDCVHVANLELSESAEWSFVY